MTRRQFSAMGQGVAVARSRKCTPSQLMRPEAVRAEGRFTSASSATLALRSNSPSHSEQGQAKRKKARAGGKKQCDCGEGGGRLLPANAKVDLQLGDRGVAGAHRGCLQPVVLAASATLLAESGHLARSELHVSACTGLVAAAVLAASSAAAGAPLPSPSVRAVRRRLCFSAWRSLRACSFCFF